MERYELLKVLNGLGIESIKYCDEAETAELNKLPRDELPQDVYVVKGAKGKIYYARYPNGKKDDTELHMGLLCHMAQNMAIVRRHVHTIKNCVVFFTVIAVISLILGFISILR